MCVCVCVSHLVSEPTKAFPKMTYSCVCVCVCVCMYVCRQKMQGESEVLTTIIVVRISPPRRHEVVILTVPETHSEFTYSMLRASSENPSEINSQRPF